MYFCLTSHSSEQKLKYSFTPLIASSGVSQVIPLIVAQTLLLEVAQCVKALSESLQLGPGSASFFLDLCWTVGYGLQVT